LYVVFVIFRGIQSHQEPVARFDAILPEFATLVRNRRVTTEKDGDYTLADLVSCEVNL
jgi:hypothetical protein